MKRRRHSLAFVMLALLLGSTPAEAAGVTQLASHQAGSETIGGGDSSNVTDVSGNGRFVVMSSRARNLVDGFVDGNGTQTDIFVFDRLTGVVMLISHKAGKPAAGGDGLSSQADISADGRFVSFSSSATKLISGFVDTNEGFDDVWLFDRATGDIELISHKAGAAKIGANGVSRGPGISADGRFVSYVSTATDLVNGVADTNASEDVFLYDRSTGKTRLVSHRFDDPKTTATGESDGAQVTDAGQAVFFESTAEDVVDGFIDLNAGSKDGYLHDRSTGDNKLVTHEADEPLRGSDGTVLGFSLSGNGLFVSFNSSAQNLVTGFVDSNGIGNGDNFVYSLAADRSRLVSHVAGDPKKGGTGFTTRGVVSLDGSVVYLTTASDIVAGFVDGNGPDNDIYLFNRKTGASRLISHRAGAPRRGGNGDNGSSAMSSDGTAIGFTSLATDLVSGFQDSNGDDSDVYVFDRPAGTLRLLSHKAGAQKVGGNAASAGPLFDDAGDVAGFHSAARNLVEDFADRNGVFLDVYVTAIG